MDCHTRLKRYIDDMNEYVEYDYRRGEPIVIFLYNYYLLPIYALYMIHN